MSINQFEPRPVIEQICLAAGFRVLNSFDEKFEDRVFENGESLCLFFWATTNGVFDPQLLKTEWKDFALGIQVEEMAGSNYVLKRTIYAVF